LETIRLDHGRLLAGKPFVEELHALGLDTLEGALRFRAGRVVRAAGRRQTRRVESPYGRAALFLKQHRGGSWGELLGRPSPARREWDNLLRLRRERFQVADPVAMGGGGGFPGRGGSFLLTREVPGTPLDELLASGWPAPPARVIGDLAALVARFHALGFFHRDLYCGHLLVRPGHDSWGGVVLIDLQRVARRRRPRRRWLVKDLAALAHSAPPAVTRSQKLRFLCDYLGRSRPDAQVRAWARAIEAKVARIRAHVPRYG